MIIALVILLVLVCYFILYTLSRSDFVLMRKDISVIRVFDYSFFYILGGYFFARLFYIIEQNKVSLAQPLVFLHVFRYPGLSTLGFFIGGGIIISLLLWKRKIVARVIDVFFLSSFPVFIFSVIMIHQPILYVRVIVALFACFLFLFLAKLYREYHLRDGSAALLILLTISSYYVVSNFLVQEPKIILNLSTTQIISAVVFIISSVVLLRKEKII